jgi:predicted transcriptional regulator
MKTLHIGIASYQEMKARTMAIARGDYKITKGEPKIWFTSAESFAKVLSDKNRGLLEMIRQSEPTSLAELAERSGREKSNLSRTLKTMEHYGLVTLKKAEKGRIIPKVNYSTISVMLPIGSA